MFRPNGSDPLLRSATLAATIAALVVLFLQLFRKPKIFCPKSLLAVTHESTLGDLMTRLTSLYHVQSLFVTPRNDMAILVTYVFTADGGTISFWSATDRIQDVTFKRGEQCTMLRSKVKFIDHIDGAHYVIRWKLSPLETRRQLIDAREIERAATKKHAKIVRG